MQTVGDGARFGVVNTGGKNSTSEHTRNEFRKCVERPPAPVLCREILVTNQAKAGDPNQRRPMSMGESTTAVRSRTGVVARRVLIQPVLLTGPR